MSDNPSTPPQEEKQPVVWRRRLVVAVLLILGVAITARVFIGNEEPEVDSQGNPLAAGLVAGENGEPVAKEETLGDKLKGLLPYITEAGMSLLLGMILGIGARMAIKTIVMVFIVGIVAIQFAIYNGWMDAGTAGGFIGHMRDYVFNVPEGAEGMDIVREKAPTAGAGLLGFMMGLKKG